MIAAGAKRDGAIAERDQTLSQMDRLQHLLRQLQRAQFGLHSEKLHPEQLQLVIRTSSRPLAAKKPLTRGRTASHPACYAAPRQPLVRFRPPLHLIGEETSRRLEVVSAKFRDRH